MHEHIQVVVMSAGPPMSRLLAQWLAANKLDWRYSSTEYGIDTARNQTVVRFLREDVPHGKTHLLGIDHDMAPIRETRHILTAPGDLIYCGYTGRHGSQGHYGDGDFGAGCFRASADLLASMAGNWWRTTVVDGRRVECECQYFRKRALAVGAVAQMVGIIGHEQTCILVPRDGGGYGVTWEEQV